MEHESIFGVDPEQLNELLSLGDDDSEDSVAHDEQSSSAHHRLSDEESEAQRSPAPEEPFIEGPGRWIGPYKLLSILGEGGMGIAYLAEQKQPMWRQVAIKVIKPGLDSRRVVSRFQAERQALALLDHPNIAHVYDAGTTELGRPYFVMEYVKGLPITEHCDHYKLTIEERLSLFMQICQAIQHAHQKGIIHRDIKPSNILVSVEDNLEIPKIIDFGIAKAMTLPLTERTHQTEESQLLGTPEYMSPEQADMASEDIDTRSDVYSLGVLLYVLLTGVLPFDSDTLRDAGIERIRQVIRETDPKTPSTRLTKLGEEARKIAESRRTEVTTLTKRLHKELEWIPLKAMRKERAERYRSAVELADDIENYLKGAPLLAGPPTTGYRLRKFVRRNKGVFAAVAAIAAVLVLAVVVCAWQAVSATQARRSESHLRQQAEANELDMRRIAYAADMRMAQHARDMNDMGRARELLDIYRPAPGDDVDLRGWEWRYLWDQCRSDAIGEFLRYEKPSPRSVAYSPDGGVLAVARWPEKFVDIWDVPGRKRIDPRQPMEGFRVAFSPRGDLLATIAGNQIRLWRTGTWDRVDEGLLTLDGPVKDLQFSPDRIHLASLSEPNELTVWNVHKRAIVRRIRVARNNLSLFGDLDFSPDGEVLVIGDCDHHLQVIDLASGNTILDPWDAHSEGIICVAWSPNGSVIASGSGWEGGPIRLWDAASGKLLGELQGHTSWISDLVFSADGLWLYSSSGDQTIRIWDVNQQRPLATLRGSRHEVLALALSPDGTTLASSCKDGVVAFWSAVPQPAEEMPNLFRLINRAPPVFAPDSRVLAVSQEGTVSLFDLATSEEIEQIPELGTDVSVIAYSPDGALLVSGSKDGTIRVWSCTERRLVLKTSDDHKARVVLLRFRADGKGLLSIDSNGTAIWSSAPTWQADKAFEVELAGRPETIWRLPAVSPDGRLLALGTRTGAMRWLNAETGELLDTTGGGKSIWLVTFSGDGLQVANTSNNGTVALWDPTSFTWVDSFRAHRTASHGVAFSPDGRRLATGGATSRDAVRLWDLPTRRELLTLPGQCAVTGFVVFSPDGRWLAGCSLGGQLNLWRAPSWEEIQAEEKRLASVQSP